MWYIIVGVVDFINFGLVLIIVGFEGFEFFIFLLEVFLFIVLVLFCIEGGFIDIEVL